jgi:hypothetical protein
VFQFGANVRRDRYDEEGTLIEGTAKRVGKGKGILVQALQGSRRLRFPEFLDSRHMKVLRLLALRTGRLTD